MTEELGIKDVEYVRETGLKEFHPGRTAKVISNGVTLGVIGVIHPTVCENFEVPEGTLCGVMDTEQLIKLSPWNVNTSLCRDSGHYSRFGFGC